MSELCDAVSCTCAFCRSESGPAELSALPYPFSREVTPLTLVAIGIGSVLGSKRVCLPRASAHTGAHRRRSAKTNTPTFTWYGGTRVRGYTGCTRFEHRPSDKRRRIPVPGFNQVVRRHHQSVPPYPRTPVIRSGHRHIHSACAVRLVPAPTQSAGQLPHRNRRRPGACSGPSSTGSASSSGRGHYRACE